MDVPLRAPISSTWHRVLGRLLSSVPPRLHALVELEGAHRARVASYPPADRD